MGDSSFTLVNMKALILIGLCALSTSAQFIQSGVLPYPYSTNLLHSGLIAPNYVPNPVSYTIPAIAPAIAPAPQLTKFHAQDELGQYNFGHFGGPSSRNEVRDAFGVVRGQVNYIDADGKVQQQNYIADALGFRVAATNLPVAPEAPEAIYLNPPKPVEDTPEVAEAKAAHLKLLAEANAAAAPAEAAPVEAAPAEAAPAEEVTAARKKRAIGSVAIHSAVAPFAIAPHAVAPPAYVAPTTYAATHAFGPALTYGHTIASGHAFTPAVTYNAAAPAVAGYDGTLLRVENNPGHAVSYRVY